RNMSSASRFLTSPSPNRPNLPKTETKTSAKADERQSRRSHAKRSCRSPACVKHFGAAQATPCCFYRDGLWTWLSSSRARNLGLPRGSRDHAASMVGCGGPWNGVTRRAPNKCFLHGREAI